MCTSLPAIGSMHDSSVISDRSNINDNPLRINYLSRNLNDTSRELLVLETSLKGSGKESENNDPTNSYHY